MGWTDIHTHFNMLEISPEEAIAAAENSGVHRFITIGTRPDDLELVFDISKRFYPKVFCTLGIHPHEAKLYSQDIEKLIRKLAPQPNVVAIGETGLDYYYDNSPRDIQQEAFKKQLLLAKELNLPIEIHTRDAEEDTIRILREVSDSWSGVIHCFTGTQYLANEALQLGLDISVSGVVTFKSSNELRDVIASVPLDRLHVETDAPFLAPVPMRGKKNQPAYVVHTAEFLANLKGVEIDVLQKQIHLNNQRTFPKLKLN